jgi:hypothetical protein
VSESSDKFKKLTPICNAEIGIYSEALDYVFKNNDLRNIAVSGAYGAGKSSVLESYKSKHGEIKFLHISLAHFQATDKDIRENTIGDETVKEPGMKESNPKEYESKESVLEGKILNQLIHQIPPNYIPQTNFKIKQNLSTKKLIWYTVAIVVFVLSFLHLFFLIIGKVMLRAFQRLISEPFWI